MEFLTHLWLPILLAAVAVFFASFLSWTVLPVHKGDFKKLPDEDAFLKAFRAFKFPPGSYVFPYMEHGKCDKVEMEKAQRAGYGSMVVMRPCGMGGSLATTFLIYLAIAFVMAYLSSIALAHALPADRTFGKVFQITGTAGVLGYAFACLPHHVWFQSHTSTKIFAFVEGMAFGLIAGAVFAFMWPK